MCVATLNVLRRRGKPLLCNASESVDNATSPGHGPAAPAHPVLVRLPLVRRFPRGPLRSHIERACMARVHGKSCKRTRPATTTKRPRPCMEKGASQQATLPFSKKVLPTPSFTSLSPTGTSDPRGGPSPRSAATCSTHIASIEIIRFRAASRCTRLVWGFSSARGGSHEMCTEVHCAQGNTLHCGDGPWPTRGLPAEGNASRRHLRVSLHIYEFLPRICVLRWFCLWSLCARRCGVGRCGVGPRP